MDATAEEIKKLAQRLFPDRPYHLAVSATARYPVPPGLWPKNTPLQYTTYISEADRGLLFTRPYFDIQQDDADHHTPNGNGNGNARDNAANKYRLDAASPAGAAGGTPGATDSKGELKKPKTKMSFKDYQQSKQLKLSQTPEAGAAKSGSKLNKPSDTMASVERQRLPPKPEFNGDSRKFHSPSKSPRPPIYNSPSVADSRKRIPDLNDSRPHKRSRSDTSMSSISPPHASSSSKYTGRIHEPPSPLDLDSRRDERSRPTATTNGQSSQAKMREKYRERDRDGDRGRERERERDRDRDPKDRDRERDRDRDRARDRGERPERSERERDRERDATREGARERERERERERDHRDRDRDRERVDRIDRDKERDRDRDRDRERDKDRDRADAHRRSPPSPAAPKTNGHKATKDRERERDRDRDRDRGRDRDRSRTPDEDRAAASSLPPILSPLHFTSDSLAKRPRATTGASAGGTSAKGKSETFKKDDSPFVMPPLLSPTLPAIVEEELSRLNKKTPLKDLKDLKEPRESKEPKEPKDLKEVKELDKPTHAASNHATTSGKKPSSRANVDTEMIDVGSKPAPAKKELVVVLKYKKKNAKRVNNLLALPPKTSPRTSAFPKLNQNDRAISIEDTPSPAQPATKKRPVFSDAINDSLPPPSSSFKHPKAFADKSVATTSRTSAGSGTPLKSTPMARGTSNTSQVPTPGDSTSHTPRSNDRPPTSQGFGNDFSAPSNSSSAHSNVTATEYRQRYNLYHKMGTKLKHDRDAIIRSRMPANANAANGAPASASKTDSVNVVRQLTTADKKRVACLSLEMVMSYLLAFKSLNQSRLMERRTGDPKLFINLMPHLFELRSHVRQVRPLEVMAVQLRAICVEQITTSLLGQDPKIVATELPAHTKTRNEAWAEVGIYSELVADSALKAVVGPWMSVEETVSAILPVMRRWNDRENAGWEQELQPPR